MATQAGGLIQDQNLNVLYNGGSVGGKINFSKAQKKGRGLGGRKPLSEVSNTAKPSASEKKSISKAQEKVQTGGRRPLGDISNSGKPSVLQAAKKNHNINLSAVVEEQFLHNHEECIKAQRKAVDIDHFLKTIGLDNDSSMKLASPPAFISRKLKPESPPRYLELDEMAELLVEDQSPPCRKTELLGIDKSSPPSPISPNLYMHWKDYNYPDFKLMETPKLPKH